MTNSTKGWIAVYAIGGSALFYVAWPVIKRLRGVADTANDLLSTVGGVVDSLADFFGYGDCEANYGRDCFEKTYQGMKARFTRCAQLTPHDRKIQLSTGKSPCLPNGVAGNPIGLNFFYTPFRYQYLPTSLPAGLPAADYLWGPRFQAQLDAWRAAVTKLGLSDLYAGVLTPQCDQWLHFVTGQMRDPSYQQQDEGLFAGFGDYCHSLWWNAGMLPRPFEGALTAWIATQPKP